VRKRSFRRGAPALEDRHLSPKNRLYSTRVVAVAGGTSFLAIENIPHGWRACETYRFEAPDVLVEVFELAEPGKDFKADSEARLLRAR
jgi:hypothetical protein